MRGPGGKSWWPITGAVMVYALSLTALCGCSFRLNHIDHTRLGDAEWRLVSGPVVKRSADPSDSPAPALPPGERPIIAVMDLADRSGELESELLTGLTDYFRARLVSSGRYSVVDKGRQAEARRKMVADAKAESYKPCYDRTCQIPLGQALAADSLLSGSIARIGSKYIVKAELIDLAREVTVSGGLARCDVEPREGLEERLVEALESIVIQMSR